MTEKLLTDVEYNYKYIDERIAEAAEKSGRKREDITFLAATKMVEPEVINHAISLGLDHIGENKVQELLSKYDKYNLDNCSLQFIGHLQTNNQFLLLAYRDFGFFSILHKKTTKK